MNVVLKIEVIDSKQTLLLLLLYHLPIFADHWPITDHWLVIRPDIQIIILLFVKKMLFLIKIEWINEILIKARKTLMCTLPR